MSDSVKQTNIMQKQTKHIYISYKNTVFLAGGERAQRGPSSLLLEEAFGRTALLDGDCQEVGGHIGHQHLLHVAEGRPPRHVVQVHVQPGRGRPV